MLCIFNESNAVLNRFLDYFNILFMAGNQGFVKIKFIHLIYEAYGIHARLIQSDNPPYVLSSIILRTNNIYIIVECVLLLLQVALTIEIML